MSGTANTRSASEPRAAYNMDLLAAWVGEARQRTCELAADLDDHQLMGPRLDTTSPILWEIGHIAWFQERWVLRHVCGHEPLRDDADRLYDSTAVKRETRWDVPLPNLEDTFVYMHAVRDRVLDVLAGSRIEASRLAYFAALSVFHEDMHTEALTYTRQTLGYPAPRFQSGEAGAIRTKVDRPHSDPVGALRGDVEVPGGSFMLGATADEPFVFDNEKWAHAVEVRPFAVARTAVTQGEFAAFVEAGGYTREEFWDETGWTWRQDAGALHPMYWKKEGGRWFRRHFDEWVDLEPDLPIVHVNWHEAEAFCRWAGRRLPTEAEWEIAASTAPDGAAKFSAAKRRFPWGDAPPRAEHANLDWQTKGSVPVAARPAGDSPWGCRQMIGNVWEWTASTFLPFPGFTADPYKEYSEPWFHTRKVLRGGCWASRGRMLRNTWRNFFMPERRDIFAGFRTCALQE